jgi:hypothetical protein
VNSVADAYALSAEILDFMLLVFRDKKAPMVQRMEAAQWLADFTTGFMNAVEEQAS